MLPQAVSIYCSKHKHDIVGSLPSPPFVAFLLQALFLQGYYNWERTRRSPR